MIRCQGNPFVGKGRRPGQPKRTRIGRGSGHCKRVTNRHCRRAGACSRSQQASAFELIADCLRYNEFKKYQKNLQKGLDKKKVLCYNNPAERYGPVAQLVRALACHARGRGFEPHPSRQFNMRI